MLNAMIEKLKSAKIINWRFALQALAIWAASNIIIGFLISQGSSEDSVYVGIIYLIFIVAGIYIALRKNHLTLYKSALAFSITSVIVFALLDYLVINLLIEGNTFKIYSEWYIAVSYVICAIIPILPFSIKAMKFNKKSKRTSKGLTTD